MRTIHHVSAITAHLDHNHQFYADVLGLRLVKRSVNQDDPSMRHWYYGDAAGSPGTGLTFFDMPQARGTVPGPGTVALAYLRVTGGSLDWWTERLEDAGSHPQRGIDHQGRDALAFADPEGQRLALVDDSGEPAETVQWPGSVPAEHAVRGIFGVDLESARPLATARFLTDLLGFQADDRSGLVFSARQEGRYTQLCVVGGSGRQMGRPGAGGVHHVAFRAADEDDLSEMRERLVAMGLSPSAVIDRYYFKSVYFREPGGILFELATDGPGFLVDEPLEHLGEKLALPPFLEARRSELEAALA